MQKKSLFLIKTILVIALLPSLSISIITMYIALDHNPMGEFCKYPEKRILETECQINWIHLFNLGFTWFVLLFILTSFVILTVKFIFILNQSINTRE